MSLLALALARRGGLLACLGLAMVLPGAVRAQEPNRYILGEQTRLEMIVHVFGEVGKPGEYRVPDDTDVLQLLSRAGGPTEFAQMNSVRLTRVAPMVPGGPPSAEGSGATGARVLKVDLDNYLKNKGGATIPTLQPGDVVVVPRNGFSKWKAVAGILRDLSVVASAYFLYLRTTQD